MKSLIDSRAVIAPSAHIGSNVTIGAYAIIEENAVIGDDCVINAHAIVGKNTRLGIHNHLYSYAVIGNDPQDISQADADTQCVVGDHNVFREFVTVSRGTDKQDRVTRIGNHNYFMNKVHIAHDATIGNHVIFVNDATLGGHVTVDDWATVGSGSQVHQFVHIGAYSFVSHLALISQDVLPYVLITGPEPTIRGINKVGLRRRGFNEVTRKQLEEAFRIIFKRDLLLADTIIQLENLVQSCPEVGLLLAGIERAKRGFLR